MTVVEKPLLDHGHLDRLGRVHLSGLVGTVRPRFRIAAGRLMAVVIEDCPALEELDLSGVPGQVRVEVGSNCKPARVRLPKMKCWLHLRLSDEWPEILFQGPIERGLIEISGDGALSPVQGLYGLGALNGLRLVSGLVQKRTRDIDHYLRIDQSQRGLQLKWLPARSDPAGVGWSLCAPLRPADSVHARLLSMSLDALQSLAFSREPEWRDRRQRLMRALGPSHYQAITPDRRAAPELSEPELLTLLLQRGLPADVVWALRAWWQQATDPTKPLDRLDGALLTASPSGRRGSACFEDLQLFVLCAESAETGRYLDKLGSLDRPTELLLLARLIQTLDPESALFKQLSPQLAKGLKALSKQPRGSVEFGPGPGEPHWSWHRQRHENPQRLVLESCIVADEGCLDAASALAERHLGDRPRIQVGLDLAERGFAAGRLLIARTLAGNPDIPAAVRAKALGCLMAPAA